MRQGIRFIGIENEEEYQKGARARLEHAVRSGASVNVETEIMKQNLEKHDGNGYGSGVG